MGPARDDRRALDKPGGSVRAGMSGSGPGYDHGRTRSPAWRWRLGGLAIAGAVAVAMVAIDHRTSEASRESVAWLQTPANPAEAVVGRVTGWTPTFSRSHVTRSGARRTACEQRTFIVRGDRGWAWVDVHLMQVNDEPWTRLDMAVGWWTHSSVLCPPP